jgi:hypothetical protein
MAPLFPVPPSSTPSTLQNPKPHDLLSPQATSPMQYPSAKPTSSSEAPSTSTARCSTSSRPPPSSRRQLSSSLAAAREVPPPQQNRFCALNACRPPGLSTFLHVDHIADAMRAQGSAARVVGQTPACITGLRFRFMFKSAVRRLRSACVRLLHRSRQRRLCTPLVHISQLHQGCPPPSPSPSPLPSPHLTRTTCSLGSTCSLCKTAAARSRRSVRPLTTQTPPINGRAAPSDCYP